MDSKSNLLGCKKGEIMCLLLNFFLIYINDWSIYIDGEYRVDDKCVGPFMKPPTANKNYGI